MSHVDPNNIESIMEEVISYSLMHVKKGGAPFASFIVNSKGTVLGRGVNRVLEHHDPTAHAEIEAIRDACRVAGTHNLNGYILYASGEPCAMCYLNASFAGINKVIYAVDRNEAANAGFDYRSSYQMLANFPEQWRMKIIKDAPKEALEPFNLWRQKRSFQ